MVQATFQEVSSDLDPTLPTRMPAIGMPGYTGRWLASSAAGADGSAAPSLANMVAPGNALVPSGPTGANGLPVLRVQGNDKFIQTDAADDMLNAGNIAFKTIAAVVRVDGASGTTVPMFDLGGIIVQRLAANNQVQAFGGSGLAKTLASGQWHVVVVAATGGAGSVLGTNTGPQSGNLGAGLGTRIRAGVAGSAFGRISLAEVVVWPNAATAAEVSSIIAKLTANHPDLFGA